MKIIFGVLLGVIILSLAIFTYYRSKDLFHPTIIFLIVEFFNYVPGLILFLEESSIHFTVDGLLKVVIFEIVFIVSFFVGSIHRGKYKEKMVLYDQPLFLIIFIFSIGLAAKVYAIHTVGGLMFVLQNGALAYQMQIRGYGLLTILYKFMLIGILALVDKTRIYPRRLRYKLILFFMVITYMSSFLIYTSRYPAFILVLILLCIFHFLFKKVKIMSLLNPKIIGIIAIIMMLSSISYNKRIDNTDAISTNPLKIVTNFFEHYDKNGRDIFTYDYFKDDSRKLLGRGYLNLIPSMIPGVENKPPTDDGFYLVNLIRGYSISFNMNFNQLPSRTGSVPFTSPGYLYANIGVVGIIIGGILTGLIYSGVYKWMLSNKNSYSIAIFFYVVYSFGFSTGKIGPLITTVLFILLGRAVVIPLSKKVDIIPTVG